MDRSQDLIRQRCLFHAEREAAARCPRCRRFFCRECTSEHEGRWLCAACILADAQERGDRARWRSAWLVLRMAAGLVAAWFYFWLVGQGLLLSRDPIHPGSDTPAHAAP